MTRLRLVLLLVALAFVGIATPARAGLLDSLLGSSSDGNGASSAEGPAADAQVGDQGCQPLALPVAPLGVGECPGVHPGSLIESDNGMCTLNFLFTGSDGDEYIGTAGHCALATLPVGQNNGEVVFAPGEGLEVRGSDGNRIGEYAYAIQEDPKDFALIRLDEGVEADPQVPLFGGPTGVNDELTSTSPVLLSNFGNPLGIGGPLATGKTFLALGMSDPDVVAATGVALPGDSGGPVLDEQGRAVGVLVNVGPQLSDSLLSLESLDIGFIGITRLTPQLEQAERAMGVDMTLQTAPQL